MQTHMIDDNDGGDDDDIHFIIERDEMVDKKRSKRTERETYFNRASLSLLRNSS